MSTENECPLCLGSGEEFQPFDEEGLSGDTIVCRVCEGKGTILAQPGYPVETPISFEGLDIIEDDDYSIREDD